MTWFEILGSVLMVTGATLSVLAAIGIVRFPSAIARMHAATKSASLGLSLVALGAGIAAGSPALTGVGLLVAFLLFVTAPISGHMVGRAAYLAGHAGTLAIDDLAAADVRPERIERPIRARVRPWRWAALVVVWMLLWRDVSIGTLVGGAIVATTVEMLRESHGSTVTLRPLGALRFFARYFGMVVASNLRVAWEVLTPGNSIVEAIVAVPLRTRSMNIALLVANGVTFTPGTLTLELTTDPYTVYAHVLFFEDADEVRASIRELEDHAIAAFGPDHPTTSTTDSGGVPSA